MIAHGNSYSSWGKKLLSLLKLKFKNLQFRKLKPEEQKYQCSLDNYYYSL